MSLDNYLKPLNNLFLRFLLVGFINTLVGLSTVFLLMTVFHLSYWISTFVGNTVGGAVSFLLNRSFTFDSQTSFKKSIPRFFIVVLICYFVSFSGGEYAAYWFNHLIEYTHLMAQDVAAVLLGTSLYTLLNFLGQKYLVFRYN
ncbi:GtrA family protein [Metabacillus sp. RGM 3146]|uniref:GtrA family protein n=1 Tax=Metabacillus sp. RGM 3146 TaxID=3401092 RepID=UPI003B9CBADE